MSQSALYASLHHLPFIFRSFILFFLPSFALYLYVSCLFMSFKQLFYLNRSKISPSIRRSLLGCPGLLKITRTWWGRCGDEGSTQIHLVHLFSPRTCLTFDRGTCIPCTYILSVYFFFFYIFNFFVHFCFLSFSPCTCCSGTCLTLTKVHSTSTLHVLQHCIYSPMKDCPFAGLHISMNLCRIAEGEKFAACFVCLMAGAETDPNERVERFPVIFWPAGRASDAIATLSDNGRVLPNTSGVELKTYTSLIVLLEFIKHVWRSQM